MLVKCPECELNVSDKAMSCPHCGYPIVKPPRQLARKRAKRKRLPNGFGQISEIKDRNLRKPFRAMVTVGKTHEGRPICRILKPEGYYETYNDAYAALLEYWKHPYDLDDNMTVKELFEKWYETTDKSRQIMSAWYYCNSLYNMNVRDVKTKHIKFAIEEGIFEYKGEIRHTSPDIKGRMKTVLNKLFDFAVERDLIEKNPARNYTVRREMVTPIHVNEHIAFTDEELKILWDNESDENVQLILFQIYTGWRPQEIGYIELQNVDIDNWCITGGMKTEAGINRLVPVHEKIKDIVKAAYDKAVSKDSKYLFVFESTINSNTTRLTYDKYRYRYDKVIANLKLNPQHRPHDPRKMFVTLAKEHEMDEYAIKRIVGHKISDITERVYTERSLEWLTEEIHKIP